ncbi:NADPH-dependent FMN reductase, partial [Neisseria sp. P0016.S002]
FDYDDPAVTDFPTPSSYTEFRETIKASAGVLFVTSENNRTVPACLKNAIDIGSKPNADVAWKKTPAGIISHSVGKMGGYSAQKNLRLALSYFDMPLTGQPEVFLGNSPTLFDDNGQLIESARGFVQGYIDQLVALIEKNPK